MLRHTAVQKITTVFVTATVMVSLCAGPAAAEGELAAEVSFDPRSEVVFKVLFASNAFVLDPKGQPTQTVVKGMVLSNTSIAVDVAGNLFVELTGRDGRGYIQVLQNSTLRVQGKQIRLTSGEAVLEKVEGAELSTSQFRVPLDGKTLSGFLFFRNGDSFLSLKKKHEPMRVVSLSGEELVVNQGQSIKVSDKGDLKTYKVVPKAAAKAMRRLPGAIRYLRAPKKSRASIEILTAIDTSVAVETAHGLEFRPVVPGEKFVLEPEFASLLMKLRSSRSLLSVQYNEDGEDVTVDYTGPVTINLYETSIH